MPTIVDSTQCHLWTDALHLRQLAREALNKWDRGTYVRMCVTSSWTALEVSCQDAFRSTDIGYRFKENIDHALAAASLAPIDWSAGVWQMVRLLQELRKTYVHRFASLADMFPESKVADDAITVVRDAVVDAFRRANKAPPAWIEIDDAHGWQSHSNFGLPNLTSIANGVRLDDPSAKRIYLVIDGEERLTTMLPSSHDPKLHIDEALRNVRVPITGIRVYQGSQLLQDLIVNMRGSA